MAGKSAREYEQISLDENSEIEDDAFNSYFSKRDTSQSESDLNISASESGTDVGESYLIDDADGPPPATSSKTGTGTAGGETRSRCRSAIASTEAARLELGSPSPTRRQAFSLSGYAGHPYFNSVDSNGSQEDSGSVRGGDSNMIEGLLCEIYDRVHVTTHNYKVDSDGFTEYSSNSDGAYLSSKGDSFQESTRLPKALLNSKGMPREDVI